MSAAGLSHPGTVRDLLGGGPAKRLARAAARLAAAFPDPPACSPSDRAVRLYRNALRLAVRMDAAQAEELFRRYDNRIRRSATR